MPSETQGFSPARADTLRAPAEAEVVLSSHAPEKVRLLYQEKANRQDLEFLAQKGLKKPAEREVVERIVTQDVTSHNYREVLAQLQNAAECPPLIQAFVSRLTEVASLLSSDQKSTRPEIQTAFSKCSISFGKDTFSLRHILGASSYEALLQRLNAPKHTAETFADWKSEAQRFLFSSRTLMAIFYLTFVHQGDVLIEKTPGEDLEKFLQQSYFDDLDAFHRVSNQLAQLDAITTATDTSGLPHTRAVATLLHTAVRAGQLDHAFARELYADIQRHGLESLYVEYFHSLTDILKPLKQEPRSFEKSETRTKKVLQTVALVLLLSVLAGNHESISKIPELANKIKNSVTDVISEFSVKLGFPVEDDDEDISQPRTLNPEEFNELLSQHADAQFEASMEPITAKEIQIPEKDGLSLNFNPSPVSAEGFRVGATSVLWEMSNWVSPPSLLVATNYTHLDPETLAFQQWLPSSGSEGTRLPPITQDALATTPNLLIGKRQDIARNWVELPTPPEMAPVAGSIIVNVKGDPTPYYYPIEITHSPYGPDVFFARFGLNEGDRKWVQDHLGQIDIRLVYSFAKTTIPVAEKIPEFPKVEPIALNELPTDLRDFISGLNADTTRSDLQKILAFQAWFLEHGEYSLNPQDDQLMFIDKAIQAGTIPLEAKGLSFYHVYFHGWRYAPLGLTHEGPTPLSGECNRTNAGGFAAAQLLDVGPWRFRLRSGLSISENVPNSPRKPSNLVTGSQAHLWLEAFNPETGQAVNIDVTPHKIDPSTLELLNAIQPPQLATPSETTTLLEGGAIPPPDFQPIEYTPPPETSRYPTEFPQLSLPLSMLQPSFSLYSPTEAVLQTNQKSIPTSSIPWEIITIPETLDSTLMHWKLPIRLNEEGAYEFDTWVDTTPINWLIEQLPPQQPPMKVEYSLRVRGTNVVPILGQRSRERFIDVNSLQIRVDGIVVPGRFLHLAGTEEAALAIDLPASTLDGLTISIVYETYLEAKPDLPPVHLLPSYPAITGLEKLGFTTDEAVGLYFHVGLQNGKHFTKDQSEPIQDGLDRHPFTYDIQNFSGATNEYGPIGKAMDLIRALDVDIVLDDIHTLARELLQIDPGFREYVLTDLNFRTKLKEVGIALSSVGSPISDEEFVRLFSPNNPIAQNELRDVVFKYLQSKTYALTPYPDLPTPYFTEELGTTEACVTTTSSVAERYRCFIEAPYIHPFAFREVEKVIHDTVTFGERFPGPVLELSLQPARTGFELSLTQDEASGESPPTEWRLALGLEPRNILANAHGTDSAPTYEDYTDEQTREEDIQREIEDTQKWYFRELLESLARGNVTTWGRFLTFFAPLAGVTYGAMRGIAHRTRWNRRRSFFEYFTRRNKNAAKITDELANSLNIPVPDFTKKQLDQAWSTPVATTREQLFLRRMVTRLGLSGRKKAPFSIFERLKKPENLWGSRELPPTYHEHVLLGSQALAGGGEFLSPEHPELAEKVLEAAMRHGVSFTESAKPLPFSHNRLLLEDAPAWRKAMRESLHQQLKGAGISQLHQEDLDQVVLELEKAWTLIMRDYEQLHAKKKSRLAAVRSRLG
jgi:hypothetical protein